MPDFYEFFAGGGMARAGLGDRWTCRFANDFDPKKGVAYRRNWGDDALRTADVRMLEARDLGGRADLAWASFPCQDLSLAGAGAGLEGGRSGTFWPFWDLMKSLVGENRAPRIVALENVCGTLTSHGGGDFAALCSAFHQSDYAFGALVIDAALFVPQSRPRLFLVGVRKDQPVPEGLTGQGPSALWHPRSLLNAYDKAPPHLRRDWLWWAPPAPPLRNHAFADVLEHDPSDVEWHTLAQTRALLAKMSAVNRAKVDAAIRQKRRMVGAVYKRTRMDGSGGKVQRAEVRFDEVAGCLRTPAGGSSRQVILVVEDQTVRSRLVSGRETARLMGLPESYVLPMNYNETYHLTGDGVVVPVVRHLARYIFEPILFSGADHTRAAA